MAATIKFTRADVARLLHLPNTDAVETLVQSKVLAVSAFTKTGRPLFDAEDVRRAASRVVSTDEQT